MGRVKEGAGECVQNVRTSTAEIGTLGLTLSQFDCIAVETCCEVAQWHEKSTMRFRIDYLNRTLY